VLKCKVNKNDANDAEGLSQLARGRFEERVRRLVERVPELHLPVDQLLMARRSSLASQDALGSVAKRMAAADERCRTLQTMPGVGPLTALAFVSAMDGPARFAKSSSVGAYLGLAPRGYQSSEVAWTGRISKTGDALARALLYEAANSLMVRVKAWPPLKVWVNMGTPYLFHFKEIGMVSPY
jgi:transposase